MAHDPSQRGTSFPDVMPLPNTPERPTFGYRLADPDAPPVVSIVTPYFNTGPEFQETVESVLRQTMQRWEWIIVDDGSTDPEASRRLGAACAVDDRIRSIAQDTNRGPGAARNAGFSAARTDLVVQLDSDDLLEPTMIEKLFWFMESNPEYAFAKGYTVGFGAESYVWVNGFHFGEAFLESNRAGITAMVRRSVHQEVGGYDENNRDGLEDWDFWLKCADHGYWGGTVHEPLSWYRRRAAHGDQWANWDGSEREAAYRAGLMESYPDLWSGGFPDVEPKDNGDYRPIPDTIPTHNQLAKDQQRVLLIVPWLAVGGADRVNLDLVSHLSEQGWGVTIATTLDGDHAWESEFARHTPDIFPMHRFLRSVDFPRFLRYLIGSRTPDVVLISNSELGYQLLPYLRAHCPEPTYMDLLHAEQADWKSGGHPNLSILAGDQLDLTVVVSEHLRAWMIDHGGDGSRIVVCHLGVDSDLWKPDRLVRARIRTELGVAREALLMVFAGRLAPEKQPSVLAETARALLRSGRDMVVVIAGDGPDRSWLETYRIDHFLEDQLVMLGSVSAARVLELLQAADLFFLPSAREGIALSIFEAMACSLPVVAADVGGQAELVTPTTGILIDRGQATDEVEGYVAAIDALASSSEQRRNMGAAGRARIVEFFTLSAMNDRFDRAIERARNLHELEPARYRPGRHSASHGHARDRLPPCCSSAPECGCRGSIR